MVNKSVHTKFIVLTVLKSLVFISVILLLVFYNISRPRIMVLHSYDPDVDIVRNFNLGVDQGVAGQIGPLINFYYMNVLSKKAIYHKVESGQEARKAIDRTNPDVLIAVGDEAQEFAAKFYLKQTKPRIIFAGVKGAIAEYGYKPGENIAGVVEHPQLGEINKLILKMLKESPQDEQLIKIGHIGDQSAIVDLTEKSLMDHEWKGMELFDSVKVNNFADFKKAFKLLRKSCDVILLSSCRGLATLESRDMLISSKDVIRWAASESKKPIVSTLGYTVSEGGDAAITSSFYEQGRMSILSAFNMLKDTSHWPVEHSSIFSAFVNKKRVHDTGVDMPIIYESLAFSSQKLYE